MFMFATGIENSNPTIQGGKVRVDQLESCGFYKHWKTDFDLCEEMGIRTVQDVLFHLPLRYQDRTRVASIGALRVGDEVSIIVEVQLSEIKFGRRRMLLVCVADGSGSMLLRFF